jgi:tripeptidyl-peptidase-1
LKIGLKSGGTDLIKKRLVETSDPESSSYGRHLTFEEIRDLSAPSSSSLKAIIKWLSSHGFDESAMDWSHSKDWVSLNEVPLQKAEEMLDTTYFYYQHDDGEMLLRTERYSLPEEIHSHVELIQVCKAANFIGSGFFFLLTILCFHY